ncbi:hypothetical protein E2L08_03285 [Palleronia sediminis]|uniref:Uncharacterized protein n=1 Tax=Palleronia sediminis TaxID=2547833 RepID=A0A4R6AJH5_9RHOB|nr:hypothetical protein [Palleronia sediminis]TDL83677.1 hypothetical protein E2L08_03285 [Palleronia sediminis]
MGELDPLRAPGRPRFYVTLTIGVAIALGLIASLAWWLQAPIPRVLIVLVVSGSLGWVAGRMMFRRKK